MKYSHLFLFLRSSISETKSKGIPRGFYFKGLVDRVGPRGGGFHGGRFRAGAKIEFEGFFWSGGRIAGSGDGGTRTFGGIGRVAKVELEFSGAVRKRAA